MPVSRVSNIVIRNLRVKCRNHFLYIKRNHKFDLGNFTFENIQAESVDGSFDASEISGCKAENVKIGKIDTQDPIYSNINF